MSDDKSAESPLQSRLTQSSLAMENRWFRSDADKGGRADLVDRGPLIPRKVETPNLPAVHSLFWQRITTSCSGLPRSGGRGGGIGG